MREEAWGPERRNEGQGEMKSAMKEKNEKEGAHQTIGRK